MLNIPNFISQTITKRNQSLFLPDIKSNTDELLKAVSGKRILVIGGAGTIGSSFIKAVLPFKPSQLFVVDISENGLTELTRDLRSTYKMFVPEDYKTYPLNYSDPIFEKMYIDNKGFDIVANFSAHKHVRSEKDKWSIQALIENNLIRAKHLLDVMLSFPPERYFCVSTDKAANPVNIMGASKRIMEDLIMSYSVHFNVTTARFANVAFSNGSLLAGFVERIMKRQPLSSPIDVKRYFVSPEESGQICMLSCFLGNNREIFFPKLNEEQMMTFSHIGDCFLHSLGYQVKYCQTEEEAKCFAASMSDESDTYPVYYFKSNTTGEKMFEEFYVEGEHVDMSRFQTLGVIDSVSENTFNGVSGLLDKLKQLFEDSSFTKQQVVDIIGEYLPNFVHEEKGKNLDQVM